MPFVGGRTLDLVNYLCNTVSKAVGEDRGLPILLVASLYLHAVSSLKNFILLVMEAQEKKNRVESYRIFLVCPTESKQGESFGDGVSEYGPTHTHTK